MSTPKLTENMAENTTAEPILRSRHPHYYKSIPPGMSHLDVYAVLRLFEVDDGALAHALKKLLCAGKRGAKDRTKDLKEARDSITRALELDEAFSDQRIAATFGACGEDDGFDDEPYDPAGYRDIASVWFMKDTTPEQAAKSINRYLDNNAFTLVNKFTVRRAPPGTAQMVGRNQFVTYLED